MINRREFVRFGAATLTTAVVPSALASADATGGNGRRLRIGILADGVMDKFLAYSRSRLLGEHVPYPVEAVHLTMVTPFGILRNSHSGRVQTEVTPYCRSARWRVRASA